MYMYVCMEVHPGVYCIIYRSVYGYASYKEEPEAVDVINHGLQPVWEFIWVHLLRASTTPRPVCCGQHPAVVHVDVTEPCVF